MGGVHDMGGSPGGPIDKDQHEVEDWERLADAINSALGGKGLQTTDELRRSIESLEEYRDLSYYERWVAATEKLLIEKGVLSSDEIDERAAEISAAGTGRDVRARRPGQGLPRRSPATCAPRRTSRERPGGSSL